MVRRGPSKPSIRVRFTGRALLSDEEYGEYRAELSERFMDSVCGCIEMAEGSSEEQENES